MTDPDFHGTRRGSPVPLSSGKMYQFIEKAHGVAGNMQYNNTKEGLEPRVHELCKFIPVA